MQTVVQYEIRHVRKRRIVSEYERQWTQKCWINATNTDACGEFGAICEVRLRCDPGEGGTRDGFKFLNNLQDDLRFRKL